MKKSFAAMSYIDMKLVSAVRSLGFETIEVPPFNGDTENPEAVHADMQILALPDGSAFLLRGNDSFNERIISAGCHAVFTGSAVNDFTYPDCVKLNIAVLGNSAIGNFKHCDKKAAERLVSLGLKLINVNQGYAKCSVSIVSSSAIITSDGGIATAAAENGIDVLKISEGGVRLCERYGGFIGGASFLFGNKLYFLGDVTKHPDHSNIEGFCAAHGVIPVSMTSRELLDIGGVVIF